MPTSHRLYEPGANVPGNVITPVVMLADADATRVPACVVDVPVRSWNSHALESGRPPFSTLFSVSEARWVFVNVQVTLPPAGKLMVATEPASVPPVVQVMSVRSHPVSPVSVTVYAAGESPVNVLVFEKSAFPASVSSVKFERPVPVVVKSKSCSWLAGAVTFVMVIVPSAVFVNVHVTFAPAASVMVALLFAKSATPPALQTMFVRSQPVSPSSVTT